MDDHLQYKIGKSVHIAELQETNCKDCGKQISINEFLEINCVVNGELITRKYYCNTNCQKMSIARKFKNFLQHTIF